MNSEVVISMVGVGGTLAGVALGQWGQRRSEERRESLETRTRFHEDRRSLYARFLAHLNTRRKYASDMATYWGTPTFQTVREEAPDEGVWLQEAQELIAEMQLVSDGDVVARATTLLMMALAMPLVLYAPSAPVPSREKVRERQDKGEEMFKDAYEPCLQAMRRSLDVAELDGLYVV